jgi:hypothetical protein
LSRGYSEDHRCAFGRNGSDKLGQFYEFQFSSAGSD